MSWMRIAVLAYGIAPGLLLPRIPSRPTGRGA